MPPCSCGAILKDRRSSQCLPCSKSGKKNPHFGKSPSKETLQKLHDCRLGDKNPNWKGGRKLAHGQYVQVLDPSNPAADCHGYVMEHRRIMAEKIGRPLLPTEIVHHIDLNPSNNDPMNLELFPSASAHRLYHGRLNFYMAGM